MQYGGLLRHYQPSSEFYSICHQDRPYLRAISSAGMVGCPPSTAFMDPSNSAAKSSRSSKPSSGSFVKSDRVSITASRMIARSSSTVKSDTFCCTIIVYSSWADCCQIIMHCDACQRSVLRIAEEAFDEGFGVEGGEVVGLFAGADEEDGEVEFVGDGEDYAAL